MPLLCKVLMRLLHTKKKRKKERKKKKLFVLLPGVKQFSSEAKSCVSAGLKSSVGLNNKQKNRICQQGAKTKSGESKKG